MKGFEDTFSFLIDYVELIFSKGWHWFILLGCILLLMTVINNSCMQNYTPIKINNTNDTFNINYTDDNISNLTTGQYNRSLNINDSG